MIVFRTWAGREQRRDTEACMVRIEVAADGEAFYRLNLVEGPRCRMERRMGE